MKKFEVRIYQSSFCSHEIEAENYEEAILIARRIRIDKGEILMNLENWEEADTAEQIKR